MKAFHQDRIGAAHGLAPDKISRFSVNTQITIFDAFLITSFADGKQIGGMERNDRSFNKFKMDGGNFLDIDGIVTVASRKRRNHCHLILKEETKKVDPVTA